MMITETQLFKSVQSTIERHKIVPKSYQRTQIHTTKHIISRVYIFIPVFQKENPSKMEGLHVIMEN